MNFIKLISLWFFMTDFITEYDSAIMLVVNEYGLLRKLNKGHELLGFVTDVGPEGFRCADGFGERYVEDSDNHSIYSIMRDHMALRESVTEELKLLLAKERGKTEDELWEKVRELGLTGAVRVHLTENRRDLTDCF